nr:toll-like receptor 4 [Crassostrea gigas]XP_034299515.1 toll-like receptor 4 [Crassostrea gigas]
MDGNRNCRMEVKKFLHVVVIIWLINEAQMVSSSICVAGPVYSNCSCTIANGTVMADCSHLELKESPKFTSIVQIVNLSFNEMEQTPVPGSLPAGLQVLDLSRNKIKIFLKSTFSGLYSLQILNISFNLLSVDDITFYKGVFGDLKALWHLEMQNNSCNSSNTNNLYPGTALQDLISLRVLEIDGLPTYNFGQEFSKLRNLSQLNLSRGHCNLSLYGLTETYFQYLTDLKYLVVRNCSITNIHNNTFLLLRNLTYLDVSDNNLLTFCGFKNVSDALIGSSIKIFKANRIYCAIGRSTFAIGKFFQSLRKTTLEELYLDDNKIDYADDQIGGDFPVTLRKLSLNGNRLSLGRYIFLNVSQLIGLKELDISYQNKHLKAPYRDQYYVCYDYRVSIKCDCIYDVDLNWLSQSGRKQPRTLLPVEDKSCDHVEMITILPPYLSSINFEYSTVGDTIPFMHLKYNNLNKLNLRGNRLTKWIGPVCNATNMLYLDLSENLCSDVSKSFFRELTGLETLLLDRNYLVYRIRNDQNGDIFRRLINLQNISIANNQLDVLPRKIFHGLVNLEALNLSTNAINAVDFDIQHMYNLSFLDLSNNFIRFFDENFTSQIDLIPSNSLAISLENNPLECSCRSLPFLKWFQKKKNSHSVTFVNNQLYNCSDDNGYPLNSGFAQLDVIIHNLEEKCRKTEWYVLVIIIILTTFVLLLLSIFIIYRHKWKIRYFVYLAKREMFKRGYERLGDDNNFKYDVFVSYAEGNRSFATKEVVKRLEGEAGLKVCLHDRDFVPGSDISDNIIGAIRHSRKIIFIVSSHFIKSDWCMYEFHMARYEETVVRKRNCTIFIFLGDIPLADLPYKIAQVRDQTVFADFPRDSKEETNFWNVLIDAVHEP